MDATGSVDENDAGATITAVTTENATSVTVDNDHFEVADGNLKLKDDASLDFEAIEGSHHDRTVEVTLTASGEGESATATVTITVNDVNEAPSIDVRDNETVPVKGVNTSLTIDENVAHDGKAAAPLALIEVMDPDEADQARLTGEDGVAAVSITGEQADKFAVILDPENGLWLALKEGMSLNHEHDDEVNLTVTFTDSAGNTASATATVTVNDVNEPPVADPDGIANITGTAGTAIKVDAIDLLELFSDPDQSDSNAVRYEVSGNPSWLKFSVRFGEDDDGNDTAHGILEGTPPAGDDTASMVTITATDGDGAEGSVSFYVIIDDGNDAITDVDLLDSNGNVLIEASVNENHSTGMDFGQVRVTDQDHAMHPNGMHLIEVLKGNTRSESPSASVDDRFEITDDGMLRLKAGKYLDFEKEKGSVDVTIRAVDMSGAKNKAGTAFTGNVEHQTISILINDQNDAPKAGKIGNWWVTAEPGQRADDVNKGAWLTFNLDTDGMDAAFTDPDAGDSLTYSLSGPSWLQINKNSGLIENTKGGVPVRGVHRVTVTATDEDGATATSSFHLAVALSGDGTDDSANDDNGAPRINAPGSADYDEGSGERRIATIRVTDDDNDLGHHPFALDTVTITSVVDDEGNATNNAGASYASAFKLSKPVKSGDTWTYYLSVTDTNPSPMVDTTDILNHEEEDVDRLTITITANDGVAAAVTDTILIRVDDVNEKPTAANIGGTGNSSIQSGEYGVSQSEANKEVLYIKLEEIWSDQDRNDDPEDLTFGASVSGSWIKILHGPVDWGDINGVTWGDPPGDQSGVVIGTDSSTPDNNEQVVIIELDRTGANNGQNDSGSFTLTARDGDGATGSKTYKVTPTDQNLNPTPNAVTLAGSAREDVTLRASFNDNKDPDLAGDATPVLVIYQWFRVADSDTDTAGFQPGNETLVRQGTSDTYRLTQADVGSGIRVKVKHYEIGAADNANQIVGFNVGTDVNPAVEGTQINGATTTRVVVNTPDDGMGHVTILADGNELSVANNGVQVTDGDYVTTANRTGTVPDDNLTITWEVSDNGRGGWTAVSQTGDDNTESLTLDDGKGKYYRAKVTYDADGQNTDQTGQDMESVYSDPIQVGKVRDTASDTPPAITGSPNPGGTLSINGLDGNDTVQWQTKRGDEWSDIPGATGNLSVTQAHAGATVRAVVTYNQNNPTATNPAGATAVVATNEQQIGGSQPANSRPVQVKDYEIEASVTGTGHPATGSSNNAGHNLSLTHVVPLASLFQDADSARLTFAVTGESGVGGGDSNSGNSARDGTYVYDSANGGVLTFETHTGKLTFNSDVYRTHDGDSADGAGNVLTLNVQANDLAQSNNTSTDTADVKLRINVAPTDIWFATTADGTADNDTVTVSYQEHVGSAAAGNDGMFIAKVDVQDENLAGSSGDGAVKGHKFGMHTVTVSGDDRFIITNTGNGKTDGDGNGSTWEVRLKKGAKFDFETEKDADKAAEGKQIELTLTATDGGGLSVPAKPAIKLTVTITDVSDGDTNQPGEATPNNVPGLNDNDGDTANDVVDGDDSDTDGGTQPPPPGMSLGGIIEDFIDNADAFEQNLLEDFMLIIDDHLDIA